MRRIIPYLIIHNQCEEALLFYKDCLDGEITFMQKYVDTDKYKVSAAFENKITHAELVAEGIKLYVSDGFENQKVTIGDNVAITLSFDTEKELRTTFDRLKVGGIVTMGFSDTSTDSKLVTLIDKYGIHWYLNFEKSI